MRVEQGDYLVLQYPGGNDEIYRIEYHVFGSSYINDDAPNPNSSWAKPAVIVLTIAIAGLAALLASLFRAKAG